MPLKVLRTILRECQHQQVKYVHMRIWGHRIWGTVSNSFSFCLNESISEFRSLQQFVLRSTFEWWELITSTDILRLKKLFVWNFVWQTKHGILRETCLSESAVCLLTHVKSNYFILNWEFQNSSGRTKRNQSLPLTPLISLLSRILESAALHRKVQLCLKHGFRISGIEKWD